MGQTLGTGHGYDGRSLPLKNRFWTAGCLQQLLIGRHYLPKAILDCFTVSLGLHNQPVFNRWLMAPKQSQDKFGGMDLQGTHDVPANVRISDMVPRSTELPNYVPRVPGNFLMTLLNLGVFQNCCRCQRNNYVLSMSVLQKQQLHRMPTDSSVGVNKY